MGEGDETTAPIVESIALMAESAALKNESHALKIGDRCSQGMRAALSGFESGDLMA